MESARAVFNTIRGFALLVLGFLILNCSAGTGNALAADKSGTTGDYVMNKRIDIHHHIFPPEYLKALAGSGINGAYGIKFPQWTVESSLHMMESNGIEAAMISFSPPAANAGDPRTGRTIARICNDAAAKLIKQYPKKFGAFATVPPLQDVEGVLNEIEYTLGPLQFDGVSLLSSYDGKYLGDDIFEEVFRELNRRKAVVYVHPADSTGNPLKGSSAIVEAPFETTRAILNLISSGTFESFPDITFIFSHAGGAMPFLAERVSGMLQFWPGATQRAPKGAMHYLRHICYDIALSGYPQILSTLDWLTDESKIMFGSDYPYVSPVRLQETISGIAEYKGFDAKARRAIERENALRLFPHLASRLKQK